MVGGARVREAPTRGCRLCCFRRHLRGAVAVRGVVRVRLSLPVLTAWDGGFPRRVVLFAALPLFWFRAEVARPGACGCAVMWTGLPWLLDSGLPPSRAGGQGGLECRRCARWGAACSRAAWCVLRRCRCLDSARRSRGLVALAVPSCGLACLCCWVLACRRQGRAGRAGLSAAAVRGAGRSAPALRGASCGVAAGLVPR